ncbi:hypothetical protein MJO28_000532 [Puccinia striiformis f. sp. tritici]|uniref:Cns1/TTC4 wheel domain-containing protein n=3 Tax=Puccinia striiformis TaxID=27350 RepID=A0A0L0W5P7_9BASI|nr:hypothetical protein Pst134EA_000709 [Puccinia striiformis f. sp. tritici]KAI9601813.1 hypothetical protein KEM48_001099 [Puccinia striiformis f. sp. tritici PST-130]KNF06807.1 hypothetical protein PSTG_00122 [Puccinia striiformis f. sp. tritici PST-78]POW05498.1 hypothetical protein PSHT_10787 [Puccinia striiformis]KAH9466855.1 hypothetical protein Pst134EB_001907 [Puccinia striiformis f. sp. tritici]KAH9473627.1 hypothetical protein Pst134EA_000709 [Puccinia striiformis f. sp. tritici]
MSQQCQPSLGPSLPPNRPAEDISEVDELMKVAGWDTVPLFMKDLPKEFTNNQASSDSSAPVNHSLEALQALIYDEDEGEKLRSLEALKARANELFGCRDYRQALGFYKQAVEILEKPVPNNAITTDPETAIPQELRNSIYSNRAACHLALGNFRSCLTDCATVLSPPLTIPATKLVRKCFFRSTKALISLERLDEALDCVDKLLSIDHRDQVIDDHEPSKLQLEIQRMIASRQAEKLAKELAEERRKGLQKALRDALQSRGISIPTHCPFPPPESSLPPGFEPVHFEEIPTEIAPSRLMETMKEIPIIYPVYVFRPKDETPSRDLILRWHEDDQISQHLESLCEGRTDSHHLYLITSKRRILKCGNNLTIRKISHSISKNQSGDSICLGDQANLEFFLLPIGNLEKEWIDQTKINLSKSSSS